MKSTKLTLLLALFSLFLFNSCDGDIEPLDPALLIPTPSLCDPPAFFRVSSFINNNTVRIEWDKTSGNEWEIEYGVSGFTIGNGTSVDFTSTSSLINGLNATVDYDFYIRTKCADDDYSVWVGPVSPGIELVTCTAPTNVSAVRLATDATKVTVTWVGAPDGNSWQVQYGNAGFTIGSGTILASATQSKVVTNLLATASYDFYVRSNCDANQNSTWVGPIVVNAGGSSACTAPTNFNAVRSATDSSQATLSWTPGGNVSTWEIQYGNVGFTAGNGTSVTASTSTKVLTGLQTTSYDFYVRAVCSGTGNSSWVGPITISAAGQSGVTYYLRMKVGGIPVAFTSEQSTASYNDLSFSILALGASFNSFNLQIFAPSGVGTYVYSNPDIDANCVYTDSSGSYSSTYEDSESPGNITITQLDVTNNRIKGTFTFIGKDDSVPPQSKTITEGEFYLPF